MEMCLENKEIRMVEWDSVAQFNIRVQFKVFGEKSVCNNSGRFKKGNKIHEKGRESGKWSTELTSSDYKVLEKPVWGTDCLHNGTTSKQTWDRVNEAKDK
jgi:hypothetical protein